MGSEHGFQWVPGIGAVPLGQPIPDIGDAMMPAAIMPSRAAESAPVTAVRPQTRSAPAPIAAPAKPLTGREILKQARARVRELDKILRAVPALQAERAALQRLIDAAISTPKPTVVPLRKSARE